MPCGGGEVGVRVETQVPRVLDRAEHQVAGQFDGRLNRITVIAGKVLADKPAQARVVHDLRAEGVLNPEAVSVDEVAADQDPCTGRKLCYCC